MFITPSDYDATVHREILDSLTRDDPQIIQICQDRAIEEVQAYLAKRYDTNAIFAATGSDRLQIIVMMTVDIAVYHIFCIHNPHKLSDIRKDRYNRAIEWCKAVSREEISIPGAPLLPADDRAANAKLMFASKPKRDSSL